MKSGDTVLSPDRLREEIALLAVYLLSSGRGLLDEPADYGVFRCTDAARRTLEILEQAGGGNAELTAVRKSLDDIMFTPMGSEVNLAETLDELCGKMASALKK
ncbi:DUF6092 family protein [Streptomyces iconiensis]|uniref:DUF6092 family protein n=1 Tax=Streptomyces iconiensis TaxID=1384038 RepID=A0ABT6ZNA9_9ACTN|nr:DUF6092 family protein [Streptomyces iconiensis]MDJ1130548.1 DUF6092 family protein [Streptomyces iconiensis]